eukprot:CAMPEP_0168532518 /NCGR_PEP_ID=MMETSP0405-20121227/16312_1 /TAXON_ID=498012 /ORGANISM="Trichosphaerium sp, Strain Am-I-7 wt" /LENGTH=129 /DNA_ID=CAMNT_0008557969 /DNA_START=785 /DNA_END=1171 /DNA_ORIENTATION=+
MYIFGGYGRNNKELTKLYQFDLDKEEWIEPLVLECDNPPEPRCRIGVCTANNKIIIVGGSNRRSCYKDVWTINVDSKKMEKILQLDDGISQVDPVFIPQLNTAYVFCGANATRVRNEFWAIQDVWVPNW